MQTPNLDRLASGGVRFTNWYANSPVCSPSRASLLTGKYPQHAGIPEILFSRPDFAIPGLKKGETTLARQLKAAGYNTAAVGKWHLGSAPDSRPRQQGFDEFFGFYSGWIDYYSHRYYTLGGQPIFHDLWRGEEEVWDEPVYQSELLAREAKAFVARQNAKTPFFLYLAFGAPHYPMMAPQKFVERFPKSMDRDRRLHAATVAALDEAIGSVLSELDRRQLTRDTIVFFQSDNGATHEVRADHKGRPYNGGSNGELRGFKGSLFDGGMHVAAMLRWPAQVTAGQTSHEPLAAMDIAPTVLRWAGAPKVADMDGIDFSAHLTSKVPLPPRTLFWEYTGQSAAREGKWKLVVNVRDGLGSDASPGRKLFDLSRDPGEKNDVAGSHEDVTKRLEDGIREWRARGYRANAG